jgi:hypothetical protein
MYYIRSDRSPAGTFFSSASTNSISSYHAQFVQLEKGLLNAYEILRDRKLSEPTQAEVRAKIRMEEIFKFIDAIYNYIEENSAADLKNGPGQDDDPGFLRNSPVWMSFGKTDGDFIARLEWAPKVVDYMIRRLDDWAWDRSNENHSDYRNSRIVPLLMELGSHFNELSQYVLNSSELNPCLPMHPFRCEWQR